MPTIADAITAIENRATTLWPALDSAKLVVAGYDFSKPVDSSGQPAPFVIIEPKWSGGSFESIGSPGSNRVRRDGFIWIHAFAAIGSGAWRVNDLLAKACSMFEGKDFGGIICWEMDPGGESDTEDGSYFGMSASIPFWFDETA